MFGEMTRRSQAEMVRWSDGVLPMTHVMTHLSALPIAIGIAAAVALITLASRPRSRFPGSAR